VLPFSRPWGRTRRRYLGTFDALRRSARGVLSPTQPRLLRELFCPTQHTKSSPPRSIRTLSIAGQAWLFHVAALPGTLRLLALLLAGGVQLFATVEPLRLSHTWDRFASGSQRFLWPVCVWLLLAAAHACIARRRRWLPLVAALCFAAGYVGWAFDEVTTLTHEYTECLAISRGGSAHLPQPLQPLCFPIGALQGHRAPLWV